VIIGFTLLLALAAPAITAPEDVKPSDLVSVIETQYDLARFKDSRLDNYLPKTPIQFRSGTGLSGETFDLDQGQQFYFGVLSRLSMLEYRDAPVSSGGPNNVGVSWHSGELFAFACRFTSTMPEILTCSPNGLVQTQMERSRLAHTIIEYVFRGKEIVGIRILSDDSGLLADANKLRKIGN
jgi:hypothetical protein